MDKKLKQKWLRALRGGRYSQARAALKDEIGYCCLGVLCTIAGGRWKTLPHSAVEDAVLKGEVISQRKNEVLAPSFRKRIGLTKYTETKLTRLNDGWGGDEPRSFEQIADYIEKRL